jgi:phage replication O-like protein O
VTRSPGPQLEKGHTRIANELLEHLATHLTGSGTQLAVMILVMRFSYGYKRKHADFTITEIARRLKVDRSNARRAVASLIDQNLMTVAPREGHRRKRYQVQKNWKMWK